MHVRHGRKVLVVALGLLLLMGLVSRQGSAAQAQPHMNLTAASSPRVNYILFFGPSPVNLTTMADKYMWVIAEIQNGSAAQVVTVTAEASGAPAGCDQTIQLILPGAETFSMLAGEYKFVLYRARYHCYAPAYLGVLPLEVELCVSAASGSHCLDKPRNLIIFEPPYERRYDMNDDAREWAYCAGGCLYEWVDWELYAERDTWTSASLTALGWLRHGIKWLWYWSHDHVVDLYPEWGTDVDHGYMGQRGTEELGGYMPGIGGGSYGYTTDTAGCHSGMSDHLVADNCGHVRRAFVDPQFTTFGYMWCREYPGTSCSPLGVRLEIVWTR
jgi:hypothetical protein